jgi:two-component system phosphate regulon sensor histidine kinase PhoR
VTLGVRAKLLLVSVALIAASAVVAEVYLTPAIASRLTATTQGSVRDRARLVAREASRFAAPLSDDLPAWDALADDLGRASGARVTIIRVDGVVLGDSEVALGDLEHMENHSTRPEVQEALAAGEGYGTHMSATLHRPLIYAAVPFLRDGAVVGVVRVAEPLTEIDAAESDMRRFIWLGSGIALGLALVLSNVLARRMAAAVGELTDAARRMTEGDLEVRTRLSGQDELAGLGQALDRLAGSLAATLGELRAERDLQRRILEAMHEGVVVVDRDGRIVLMNPALRSTLLLGADAIGKLLIETVRHAELDTVVDQARESPDDPPVEIELPGLKPRRLLVQAAPLSGDDQGLLLVFVDVTELRRLESLRRDFVANASHELRTPIAAVRSATETLQTGALGDPIAANRFLDIIERNAQRLQSLVEDMLELSKLESNEFKLKRERVELQRVVPIVLALFRERAEKKGVRLGAELAAGLPAVEGDPRALEHVLSNLVDNAVKYCPSGTRIVVSATADDARVRLVVADTGPGIPAEHLPRVFERFYRVDAGRSRELGGTGLGLSIVKHMVETMSGKVAVESSVGRGSTFIVSLQRMDAVTSALRSESV